MSETTNQAIRVQLRSIPVLFNSLDPSPFRERDIDPEVERHIVDWARELPKDAALRLVIELPAAEAATSEAKSVPESLRNYFAERARQTEAELRELFRIGWRSLQIGIVVLVGALTASQTLVQMIPNETLRRVFEESMIIVGWVANWRPIEIYLYEWWPIVRRRQLYRRLAGAPVVIEAK